MWVFCPGIERHDMKPWKAALGVGVSCAVCCAAPLLSSAVGLAAGSFTLVRVGLALLPCTDELFFLAFVLLAVTVGAGVFLWRRRRARVTPVASGCSGACHVNA